MNRPHVKALCILGGTVAIFYWKILFTRQFSLLTGSEAANQAYAWYHFIALSIKQGHWPTWDPFTFSGRSFVGEMQTAAFYPLNLLLAAIPFNKHGLLAPSLYHYIHVLTHVAGAYFLFCLCHGPFRLGLSASILSGICFSLGGIVAWLGEWPHLHHSAIWLPVILWLLIRSLEARGNFDAVRNAVFCGLALGMAILAGGLHIVFMHMIVMVSAVAASIFCNRETSERPLPWKRGTLVLGTALAIGIAAGAVQLLPSMEYSQASIRYLAGSNLPASEKIPYHMLNDGLQPAAIAGLIFAVSATGLSAGEYINPYMGVFPIILAVIGILRNWQSIWVRYLSVLALGAFLYSLGAYSLVHGLAYATVPKLWAAREASRFMLLVDFTLAILAGFGFDALFYELPRRRSSLNGRGRSWVLSSCASLLSLFLSSLASRRSARGLGCHCSSSFFRVRSQSSS